MVRDWMLVRLLCVKDLVGAKPLVFNLWILDLLNYQKGDVLDLFPGTNGMAEAIATKYE
jgi:hypothetical protein